MQDFDKIVAEANLRASGWNIGDYANGSVFDMSFVYIYDPLKAQPRLIAIPTQAFNQKINDVAPVGLLVNVLRQYFNDLDKQAVSISTDETFVPVLVAYIQQTKAYGLWREQQSHRLHFFINMYGADQEDCCVFRPFALCCDDVVIDARTVLDSCKQVFTTDQVHSPHLFRRGR